MAMFLVSLAVEIDADTHREAAQTFQGALSEYAVCEPMTYEVTGYATDNSPRSTTEHVELMALPATTAQRALAECLHEMIVQERHRIWDNNEPVEGYENGREAIDRFGALVMVYASLPGADQAKYEHLKVEHKEMVDELPPEGPDPDDARDAALENEQLRREFGEV